MRSIAPLVVLALVLAPLAAAGTPEDPEIVDPKGDCAIPTGNAYLDIVSAWVSDETATDFMVNIRLDQFVAPVANGAGYTVQFSHQGVQFGAVASYFLNEWGYANGVVDGTSLGEFRDSTGSFEANPPTIRILFHKDNFPHTDMSDNSLVDFTGASADLKVAIPFFVAGQDDVAGPLMILCDSAVGTKTYEFQHGQHSMGAPETNETPADGTQPTDDDAADEPATLAPATSGGNDTPGPGVVLAAVAAVVATLALRRRA